MTSKKLHRKLRKQCKKLRKWAEKHGVERVDFYINVENDFEHAFIPDGPTYVSVGGVESYE